MPRLLDMVKVLSFALQEGKVGCSSLSWSLWSSWSSPSLSRSSSGCSSLSCRSWEDWGALGLLPCLLPQVIPKWYKVDIKCVDYTLRAADTAFFIFRVRSNDAIRYVRLKRPNMVETRLWFGYIGLVWFYVFFISIKGANKASDPVRQRVWNLLSSTGRTFTIFHNLMQSDARQLIKFHEKKYSRQCVVYSTKPPNERDKKLGRFPVETCLKRFSLSLSFRFWSTSKFLSTSDFKISGKSTWCMVSKRGRWNIFPKFFTLSASGSSDSVTLVCLLFFYDVGISWNIFLL